MTPMMIVMWKRLASRETCRSAKSCRAATSSAKLGAFTVLAIRRDSSQSAISMRSLRSASSPIGGSRDMVPVRPNVKLTGTLRWAEFGLRF